MFKYNTSSINRGVAMQKLLFKVKEKGDQVIISKVDFDQIISEIEALEETIEVLMDKEAMQEIERSKKEIDAGKVFTIKSEEDLDKLLE